MISMLLGNHLKFISCFPGIVEIPRKF